MAKKSLFMYAVLLHPKTIKDAQGNETQSPDRILRDPTWVLAGDEKEVAIMAARQIPDEALSVLDQVEVLVRPF